tara:strand:+ start:306 stop:2471 length:2166 start_codon:yes stop_codon:yes gene_type:complete
MSTNQTTNMKKHVRDNHSQLLAPENSADLKKMTDAVIEFMKPARGGSIAQMIDKIHESNEFDALRTYVFGVSGVMKLTDIEHFILFFIKYKIPFSKLRNPEILEKDWKAIGRGVKLPEGISYGNHAQKIADFAAKVRDTLISRFGGKDVTLITDKGRIWNDYLPICIVEASTGEMLLYDLVHIDKTGGGDIADARAESMAVVVQRALRQLKGCKINVLALCTDNASNMTKLGELISSSDQKLVTLGCMCHGIALTHNDSVAANVEWTELITRASELRKYLNASAPAGHRRPLPEANDTRWNSKLRLSVAVVNKYGVVERILKNNVPDNMKFSAEDLDFLATMNDIMKHFQIATKIVESNKSTITHAALAYQVLFDASKMNLPRQYAHVSLKIKDSLIERSKNRFVLPDLLAAFLFCLPIVDRASFKSAHRPNNLHEADYIDLKNALINILTDDCLLEAFGIGLEKKQIVAEEFNLFLANDPYRFHVVMHSSTNLTINNSLTFFEQSPVFQRCPHLKQIFLKMMKVVVNEAGVERLFSLLKDIVSEKQMQTSPKKVVDTLSIKLATGGASGLGSEKEMERLTRECFQNEDDVIENDDEEDQENDEEDELVLTQEMCHFALEQVLAGYRERSNVDKICALCLHQDRPRATARHCLHPINGVDNTFQCPTCYCFFGFHHYAEEFQSNVSRIEAYTQKCFFCMNNQTEYMKSIAKNKKGGRRGRE